MNLPRHPDFYFPDGNVCLVSKDLILFRVLKSQLAQRSEAFADLFNLSSDSVAATDSDSYLDGAVVIRLDDSTKDLERLFTILWQPPLKKYNLDFLCSALRMSTKYVMESIRQWSILQLIEMIPGDTVIRAPITLNLYVKEPSRAREIIDLGQKCYVPEILPLAFYALATTNTEDLDLLCGELPKDYYDMVRLSLGKDRLRSLWRDYVKSSKDLSMQFDTIPECENLTTYHTPCEIGRKVKANARQEAVMLGAADPLRYLFRATNGVSTMCSRCQSTHVAYLRTHLNRIFEALPKVFNLSKTQQEPARAIVGKLLSLNNSPFTYAPTTLPVPSH